MHYTPFEPPPLLRNGFLMTVYTALWEGQRWQATVPLPDPPCQTAVFKGMDDVPLWGWYALPQTAAPAQENVQRQSQASSQSPAAQPSTSCPGTLISTYGITGSLADQWLLSLLARKAYHRGFGIVAFDWRAHGKTAELSPTLTSDGLFEGYDFVHIAAQAKARGCPPPFWFVSYSLGGQLALWGNKAAEDKAVRQRLGLADGDIGGAAVICPSLESNRSLAYLEAHPLGRYLERAMTQGLVQQAWRIHAAHPNHVDPAAIARATTIRGFDQELVISRLGFASTAAYYDATSPLYFLPHLTRPTLIIYAEDDPIFHPSLVNDLGAIAAQNPALDLRLTQYGGHVGYLSSARFQRAMGDPDPWWAWNRLLDWCDRQSQGPTTPVPPAPGIESPLD
ncbi:MAG: esterase [Synechococcales bacterium]|nr:esterase [Synechococcales bacterium]